MQHNGGGGTNSSSGGGTENLTKFSVEIVQQLEFTTSTANSQPQQISTNVTVKALTNTSVKNETQQQQQQQSSNNNNNGGGGGGNGNNGRPTKSPSLHDLGHLVECKQEPDHDFADLDQCAAALEKDGAANGNFPGLSELIGDDGDLLISDLSDFQSEYLDFEEKPSMVGGIEIKQEEHLHMKHLHHQQQQQQHHHQGPGGDGLPPGLLDAMGMKGPNQQQQQQHPQHQQQHQGMGNGMNPNMMGQQFGGGPFNSNDSMNKSRLPFGAPGNVMMNGGPGGPGGAAEMSPAAQTLKHMAEQHQHKNAMGGFPRPPMHPQQQRVPPNGNNNNNSFMDSFGQFCGDAQQQQQQQQSFQKGVGGFPGAEANIKQEMMYSPQNEFEMKMKMGGMGGNQKMPQFKGGPPQQQAQQQQGPPQGGPFSPYGSPGAMSNHGSPAGAPPFMGNRGGGGGGASGPGTGASGGQPAAGPPRPASGGHPQQQQQQTLQMKQSQQLHITQQGMGHGLQVRSS